MRSPAGFRPSRAPEVDGILTLPEEPKRPLVDVIKTCRNATAVRLRSYTDHNEMRRAQFELASPASEGQPAKQPTLAVQVRETKSIHVRSSLLIDGAVLVLGRKTPDHVIDKDAHGDWMEQLAEKPLDAQRTNKLSSNIEFLRHHLQLHPGQHTKIRIESVQDMTMNMAGELRKLLDDHAHTITCTFANAAVRKQFENLWLMQLLSGTPRRTPRPIIQSEKAEKPPRDERKGRGLFGKIREFGNRAAAVVAAFLG